MDPLTYLEKRQSLFWEDDEELLKRRLLCASCGHPVTAVSETIDINTWRAVGSRDGKETVGEW